VKTGSTDRFGVVRRPSSRLAIRVAAALLVGLMFASYEDLIRIARAQPSDFAQVPIAGRLLLEHKNPYQEIGPEGSARQQFRLFYPIPAAVVGIPFTWVSPRLADALFVGLGAALLMWALTKERLRNPQLLVFVSIPMVVSAQTAQWSPWLTSVVFVPAMGFLYACKPSVAAAYLLAFPSRLALTTAAVFGIATLLIWPWWPGEWLTQLSTIKHMSAPVTRTGGFLLLLAALRWRRPEARLLLGLSLVPQTPVAYEAVPLFLLVSTIGEGVALWASTLLLIPVVNSLSGKPYDEWMALSGQWMIWLVYLPALAIVLRRPNIAPLTDPFADWARPFSRFFLKFSKSISTVEP
jgi:hypothetical protein